MKFFLILALCVCATPAFARSYTAQYDVYAGGIHALQARLTYAEDQGRYRIDLASETYGILGKIIPWNAKFMTTGWVLKDRLQPEKSVSDTTAKKKHEVNSYSYDKSGKFLNFTQIVNGKDETIKDLDPAIYQGTTDILSTNFNLMRKLYHGGDCSHSDMIFDSERSYRLDFKKDAKTGLSASKYNIYKGEAVSCSAEVTPVGGKWHKKPRGWLKIQDQARKAGKLPTVWYGNLLNGEAAPAVPVKIMIKSNFGTFIAHLTSFEEKP